MTTRTMTDEELMQEFERKAKEAKEANKSFDNFFFFLKEDEKAVVHPLLNVPQLTLTETQYHEKFDHVAGKMVADNVCAAPFGRQCKLCKEAEFTHDKKLKASARLFLPVYVHGVYKTGITGEVVAVTTKDDAGVERKIQGVRMLKLKLGGSILDSLKEVYYDSEDRSILSSDFVITRRGSGLDTSYKLTSRKLAPITEQLLAYTAEKAISDVRVHREEQSIEDPFAPAEEQAQNFSVDELMDMKQPTEKQLKELKSLCALLDKDWPDPVSFGQAANLLRNMREEYAKQQAEEI